MESSGWLAWLVACGRGVKARFQVLGTRRHIQTNDEAALHCKGVARYRGFDLVARQDVEL